MYMCFRLKTDLPFSFEQQRYNLSWDILWSLYPSNTENFIARAEKLGYFACIFILQQKVTKMLSMMIYVYYGRLHLFCRFFSRQLLNCVNLMTKKT